MPKGYTYKKPKKPQNNPQPYQQDSDTSNLYTVARIIEEWVHNHRFIILEKNLEIYRSAGTFHNFSFKNLSPSDVESWRQTIGNRARSGMGAWTTWPPRTEYFLVTHHELMTALHNFLASDEELYNSSFTECKSSGKFSQEELMEIFPQWVKKMQESQKMAEMEMQEMERQDKMKEIQKKKEMDERLGYEVKKKIIMHGLDKKLNPKEEETKPKTPKPKYDTNSRLTNIGIVSDVIISDKKFQETGYPFMFELDRQGLTHTLVVGGSGSGKTITAMDIAEGALEHDIPVLVIDPIKRQWTGLFKDCDDPALISLYPKFGLTKTSRNVRGNIYTPSRDVGVPFTANLLAIPDSKDKGILHAHARKITNIIKEYCHITKEKNELRIRREILANWADNQASDYDWKTFSKKFSDDLDLQTKLETLIEVKFLFDKDAKKLDFSQFMNAGEVNVFDLNHLSNERMNFFSYFILRKLNDYFISPNQKGSPKKMRLLLVIEESHLFSGQALNMLIDIAKTLRQKGVGCLFVSQRLKDLNVGIRSNCSTRIFMNIVDGYDQEEAKKEIGELGNLYPYVDAGNGIAILPKVKTPIPIMFRPCFSYTSELSEDEVKGEMKNRGHLP